MSKIRNLRRLGLVVAVAAALTAGAQAAMAGENEPPPRNDVSGVVLDDVGQPIPGAVVESADGRGSTVADESGAYSMEVPVGRHVLVASEFGFDTVSREVDVPVESPAVADFELQTLERLPVSGQITDGDAHQWPLYAKISVVGMDRPIFTDPHTGQFDDQLPDGEHQVIVESLYGGYQHTDFDVTVEGSDTDLSHALDLNDTCGAPGYSHDGSGGCAADDGGMLIGHVTADGEDTVVDRAIIEDLESEVVATSGPTRDDTTLRDGFYFMFTPVVGAHTFEVRHNDFAAVHEDVEVVADEVTFHEFSMG